MYIVFIMIGFRRTCLACLSKPSRLMWNETNFVNIQIIFYQNENGTLNVWQITNCWWSDFRKRLSFRNNFFMVKVEYLSFYLCSLTQYVTDISSIWVDCCCQSKLTALNYLICLVKQWMVVVSKQNIYT